jgi:DisA bacterial checkpoint controller nucleotide-binding
LIIQGDLDCWISQSNITNAINSTLAAIESTARCVAICRVNIKHPSRSKKASVTVDSNIDWIFQLVRKAGLNIKTADAMEMTSIENSTKKSVERAVEEVTNALFETSYRPFDVATAGVKWFDENGDADWDWIIRGDAEDAVSELAILGAAVVASQPYQNRRCTRTQFLLAFMSEPITKVLDRGYIDARSLALRNDTPWWTCQSLEEAVVFKCMSDAHLRALQRRKNEPESSDANLEPDFLRDVAAGLMEFHAGANCDWGYVEHRKMQGVLESTSLESLFEWSNRVSHQIFEDKPLFGYLGLVNTNDQFHQRAFSLKKPVSCEKVRSVGKLISASSPLAFPIMSRSKISHFGRNVEPEPNEKLNEPQENLRKLGSTINFLGRGRYRWLYRDKAIFEVYMGQPRLARPAISAFEFSERFGRCFPGRDCSRIWGMVEAVVGSPGGASLIICGSADREARRLGGSFAVEPFAPQPSQVAAFASLDGGVLVNPDGVLFAFGVLLDGAASAMKDDSSRGSRYNSAVRYAQKKVSKSGLLIVVVSQDGMVDLIGP